MITVKAYSLAGQMPIENDGTCFFIVLQEEDVNAAISQLEVLEGVFARDCSFNNSYFTSNADLITSRYLETRMRLPDGNYCIAYSDGLQPEMVDKNHILQVWLNVRRLDEKGLAAHWEADIGKGTVVSNLWLSREMRDWLDRSCKARRQAHQEGLVSALQ